MVPFFIWDIHIDSEMISALPVGNESSVTHELAVSTGSGGGCDSWKGQEVISVTWLSIFSDPGGCRLQFWFWAVCLYVTGRAENISDYPTEQLQTNQYQSSVQ